jgi:hypothetical protein
MKMVVLAASCILAGCGGSGSSATSGATNTPTEASTPAPARTAPPWLHLAVGTQARLGSNGGDDTNRDDVYNTLDDLNASEANGGGHTTTHLAEQIVRVLKVGPVVEQSAGVHAVRIAGPSGWTDWVQGEINLHPIPPTGTIFVLKTVGNAPASYYPSQADDAHEITVNDGTRAQYLGFAPKPGDAEMRVKILDGTHIGAIGYLVDLNLQTQDYGTDIFTTEVALASNDSTGSDTSSAQTAIDTPTPGSGEPCDRAMLDDKHAAVANAMMQHDEDDINSLANDLMNAEDACAESTSGAQAARHYQQAGQAALVNAVYGPDIFGHRKTNLDMAKTYFRRVIDSGDADPQTEKAAEDGIESVNEKLEANSQ